MYLNLAELHINMNKTELLKIVYNNQDILLEEIDNLNKMLKQVEPCITFALAGNTTFGLGEKALHTRKLMQTLLKQIKELPNE